MAIKRELDELKPYKGDPNDYQKVEFGGGESRGSGGFGPNMFPLGGGHLPDSIGFLKVPSVPRLVASPIGTTTSKQYFTPNGEPSSPYKEELPVAAEQMILAAQQGEVDLAAQVRTWPVCY